MKTNPKQPGIMLYFDMAEPLKALGYEEKGRLLDAMMEYGEFGVVPDFDGILTVVWGFLRPKLDADARRYREKVIKAKHSSYCSAEKRKGNEKCLAFEDWCISEGIDTTEWIQMEPSGSERLRAVPDGIGRHPTTTTNSSTYASETASADAEPKLNPGPYTDAEAKGGKGGEPQEEKDFETRRQEALAMIEGVMREHGRESYKRKGDPLEMP